MEIYEITLLEKVDFGATGISEVIQNVRFILTTMMDSCPMDRDFSWNPAVDAPMNVAQTRITARVIEAIEAYEPRAEVMSVTFDAEPLNGRLIPKVRVKIHDEST